MDEPDSPVRIIIGIDGSRNAKIAVDKVLARNWPPSSEVRVVVVEQLLKPTIVGELVPPITNSIEESNQEEHEYFSRLTKAAARRLNAKGLRATAEVAEGDPKSVLVQMAEEWRADCIFLGATGLSNRLERFLLGSVAGAVAARAHCSVEIVRTKKRKRKTNGKGD